MTGCRLLPFALRDGALNMAIDEALLLACEAGGAALTLRLYGWARPTLSLGYFQAPPAGAEGPWARLPMVRRLTGGGAIVHDAEVTYSVVWRRPAPAGIPQGVANAYAHLNRALAVALRSLGVEPARAQATPSRHFLCFRRRSLYDLVAVGQKVVGSAQRRRRGAVLQHGSLLVGPSGLRGIADRSVSELAGRDIALEEAAAALVTGFEEALGWRPVPGSLSVDEGHLAEGLRHHKYNHVSWGGRRRARPDAQGKPGG